MINTRLELELDRVAGESKITVYLKGSEVRVEYSGLGSERLFEHLVTGRNYRYVPYIVARICGVCSHAHFWASNLAIESALGIEVDETTAELRDVCNKLQIVENHLVHLVFLALPDYYNLEVNAASSVFKAGNTLKEALNTLCGRLSSPQAYLPGGFTKDITMLHIERATKLLENLAVVLNDVLNRVFGGLVLPRLNDPSPNYLALTTWPEKSVPIGEPYVLVGSTGSITVNRDNYLEYFNEFKPEYSKSKTCTLNGQVFFVGARARLIARKYANVNSELFEIVRSNPFGNLLAKAVETLYLIEDVVHRLRSIAGKTPKRSPPSRSRGRGLSVVEAPRGLLVHYYEVSEDGRVEKSNIITPTVMFAKHVEMTIETLVKQLCANRSELSMISKYVEMLVRSYDPCIPCAVHVVRNQPGKFR